MSVSRRAAAPAVLLSILAVVFSGDALLAAEQQPDPAELREQVAATERAFAATMAARDHEAFIGFLSAEAIFISGDETLRGRMAVAQAWQPYFEGPDAPFSWAPETVEVLDSGTLALSSGPVFDAADNCIGSFQSIWRLEAPSTWRIVFDKGSSDCD